MKRGDERTVYNRWLVTSIVPAGFPSTVAVTVPRPPSTM